MLYALREGIAQRHDLTLWLVASHFRREVSRLGGAVLVGEQELGVGVKGGLLDGFPTFFIDLHRLPVQPETLSLLMVAKGPQERELIESLVDHFREYPRRVQLLRELHVETLREVLRMRQLSPEQIGIDYRALLDLIGEERAIDLIGEERAIEDIVRRKGEQWVRAAISVSPKNLPPREKKGLRKRLTSDLVIWLWLFSPARNKALKMPIRMLSHCPKPAGYNKMAPWYP